LFFGSVSSLLFSGFHTIFVNSLFRIFSGFCNIIIARLCPPVSRFIGCLCAVSLLRFFFVSTLSSQSGGGVDGFIGNLWQSKCSVNVPPKLRRTGRAPRERHSQCIGPCRGSL
jgi:hypothetical protein